MVLPRGQENITRGSSSSFRSLDPTRDIYVIPTSYVEKSEGVQKYLEFLVRGNPTAAYEFVQNQWDYNNDPLGQPEIWLCDSEGQRISYPEFLKDRAREFRSDQKITRVEFINYLRPGEGMTPEDVVLEKHGGDEGTLGAHGRGGKIAGAALITGRFASSIEYLSKDDRGTWRGETAMVIDNEAFPDLKTPVYSLGYQRVPEEAERDKTIVAINDPSEEFLECFRNLSNYFLLVNSRYENYRFNHAADLNPQANLLNIFIDEDKGQDRTHSVFFSSEERTRFKIPDTKLREPVRVEILPWDLIKQEERYEYKTDSMFVDGLRLETSGYFALRWSFWGFSKAEHSFKVERSTNSDYVHGNPENLIAMVLGKCDNPLVFESLLNATTYGNTCAEGEIPLDDFYSEISKNPQAITAFKQGWRSFCAKHTLDPSNLFITSDHRSVAKAEKLKKRCILLSSPTFVKTMHQLGIAKELEQTVELPVDPQRTGERLIVIENKELSSESIISDLLEVLLKSKAVMHIGNNGIMIDLPFLQRKEFSLFGNIKSNLTLGRILRSTEDFWRKFGESIVRRVEIDSGGEEGSLEMIEVAERETEDFIFDISPITQSGKTSGRQSISIRIICKENRNSFNQFLEELKREFSKVEKDGFVDEAKWIKEGPSRLGALDRVIEAKRRVLQNMQAEELDRLAETEAKLADARRLLGQIEEDSLSDSPTRRGLTPLTITGYRPPRRIGRAYTSLRDPNIPVFASNTIFTSLDDNPVPMEVESIRSTLGAREYVEQTLESLEKPDLQLLRPDLLPVTLRDTLVCGINTIVSAAIEYEHVLDFSSNRTIAKHGLIINKKIEKGTYAVPCFVNCRVVGFYHPDPIIAKQLRFNLSDQHSLYTLSSELEISSGLEIYYEYDPENHPSWIPGQREAAILGKRELLKQHWRDLMDAVDNFTPPLSNKQRLDIALTAWLHAFNYDSSRDVDKLFFDLPEEERFSEIINNSSGNCGYTAEGFAVLCRFFNLPSVKFNGYLGNKGRYFPGPQNHALDAVYIDNKWIVVEPQAGYISTGFRREEIPPIFIRLIEKIPKGKNSFPADERAGSLLGVDGLVKRLKEANIRLDQKTIEMIRRIQKLNKDDAHIYQMLQLTEEPAIPGFEFVGAPGEQQLDEIIRTNPGRQEIFSIDDENAEQFISSLLTQAAELGLEVNPNTTADELIGMIQKVVIKEEKRKRRIRGIIGGSVAAAGIVAYLVAKGNLDISALSDLGMEILERIPSTRLPQINIPSPFVKPTSIPLPLPAPNPVITPEGVGIKIPQMIDSLKLNSEVIRIIIAALLSSGATRVRDAIHYAKIINKLKEHENSRYSI